MNKQSHWHQAMVSLPTTVLLREREREGEREREAVLCRLKEVLLISVYLVHIHAMGRPMECRKVPLMGFIRVW